ncbi:flagellar export protein FliJ [Xanthobacter dioxanivorans]|uniref:Flagellar export protein FliJ n=1 Tax=Xanthobacter dioxanivorans TaxID=2528964 RepID=A0A974SI16_9HYPH|nr:flagellar export protein FliJ [Xanthobacter dioxanivorans]QRG04928.1 flagellar export protein FliJ [Xanthobacter dioxanivorans]
MKSRDPLIRAKRFQIEDARRRLVQIEAMIADFERMAQDLERDIAAEEERSGITDPRHFAYPPLALAARNRRDNLRRSAEDLATQQDDAKAVLAEAEADLALVEAAGEMERTGRVESPPRRAPLRPTEPARH